VGLWVSELKRELSTDASSARQAQILDAAQNLFYLNGYGATSIQEIADAVGLLKGSLYYHIPSKESVLFEIVRRVHEGLLTLADNALDATAPPLEQVRALVACHCEYIAENNRAVSIFFTEYRALSDAHRTFILAKRDEYEARIRNLIDRGQASAEISKNLDPTVMTMGILGMMNWLYQWYRHDGSLTGADIGRQIAALSVRALSHID
jgi:TetR/AcrR family transcriptional regulator, cholesterol catabolism regulator